MKKAIIFLLFLILGASDSRGQSGNVLTREIVDLFDQLNEKYGNLYLIDKYRPLTIESDSSTFSSLVGIENVKFITQERMFFTDVNFDSLKSKLPPTRILSVTAFRALENPKTIISEDEMKYSIKLDSFNEIYLDNIIHADMKSDSLNTINNLLSYSVRTRALTEKYSRNQKKYFQLRSVYMSKNFYLIVYTLNFGHFDGTTLTELIMR